MKHNLKITLVLLGMFFLSQLIGIGVIYSYSPTIKQINIEGNLTNISYFNLPFHMEPPQNVSSATSLASIISAIIIAVLLMLLLIKMKAETFLRLWFFVVVVFALSITLNSLLFRIISYSQIISLLIALPIAYIKIFKRHILTHNISELFIYPGIAAIFVPLLNLYSMMVLLILISIYDIYAVWHAGFMQKMANYQIKKVKVFSGFFVPYLTKKQKELVNSLKNKKSSNNKKMKVSVAILGGGDIVFPMILAGIVLHLMGFLPALTISLGAALGLAGLFTYSKKGKFYPAMPFISAGCFVALGVIYLVF